MKILWLSLLLAGLCLAKEEEAADDLQGIEGRGLERSPETSCSGCSKPSPSSSSVVVPNINLPLLGGNKDILQTALSTANDILAPPDPTNDLLLLIGNLLSALNPDQNAHTVDLSGKPLDLEDLTGNLGNLAALEGIGSLLTLINNFKFKVLYGISYGLEVANIILSIIAVGMLIGYIYENDGKLGVLGFGLTGSEDEETDYPTGTTGFGRSLTNSPVLQGLTNLVYDAISKYD